ncbi:MAG: chitobiase/beta-hexosaminidase C-terminal domain-containing protein [Steroidobacteraceae bacterium]
MKNSWTQRPRVAGAILGLLLTGAVQAQVSVTTFHNDNARTGQNTQETVLTPANVNSQQFGKLFSVTMDGQVYAQPLYVPGVSIGGSTHNVVYVVTENDSLYAIDGDSGQVLNQVSLIPAGGSAGSFPCSDLTPVVGITGTPVIDPPPGNTIYLITNVNIAGGIAQFLHALDITTLTEKFNGPVEIGGTVAGTGTDGNGSSISFDAKQENQRPGLLLENGHVIIAWGSHCDYQPWHGWLMSYGAGSLAQEAIYNVSPNGTEGGIWMSGGGVATDGNGNIFVVTGNGDWNGTTDFGDSVLKFGSPANDTFPLLDYFTPWNQAMLDANDLDLSSGALVLLPPLPSGQAMLAQQGKYGTIVLLDQSNLGKYCPNQSPACSSSDTNVVQELTGTSQGIWGSPAYWNGSVYFAGNQGPIKAYSFNANGSGKLSTSPTSQTPQTFAFAAPTPVISANGNSNGILWAVDGSSDTSGCGSTNCLGLFAYDATNLATLLYSSNQTANSSSGATVKFASPTVANGKVYVGTQAALLGYGLLSTTPTAATPGFSPTPGTYGSTQTVSLSDSTPGAVIYYTTNGQQPTSGSTQYVSGSPLSISTTTTIQAIAVASGYNNSGIGTATYTISTGGGGTGTPVSVALGGSANLSGIVANGTAVPNGGLDGGGYAYSATLLGTSLTWSGSSFTLGASGASNAVWGKTIALPAGNYSTIKLLGSGVNGAQANQTFVVSYTDGTTSSFTQSMSDWFYPQGNNGESSALTMAYRLNPSGATGSGPCYLYGYAFSLNSAKTVASITLPNNRNAVFLAADLSP